MIILRSISSRRGCYSFRIHHKKRYRFLSTFCNCAHDVNIFFVACQCIRFSGPSDSVGNILSTISIACLIFLGTIILYIITISVKNIECCGYGFTIAGNILQLILSWSLRIYFIKDAVITFIANKIRLFKSVCCIDKVKWWKTYHHNQRNTNLFYVTRFLPFTVNFLYIMSQAGPWWMPFCVLAQRHFLI